jgi:hypothetical protein
MAPDFPQVRDQLGAKWDKNVGLRSVEQDLSHNCSVKFPLTQLNVGCMFCSSPGHDSQEAGSGEDLLRFTFELQGGNDDGPGNAGNHS